MNKGWRIILGIVLVAVLLGAICMGVGLLTGADTARIIRNLDDQYQLTSYVEMYASVGRQLVTEIVGIFAA
ncbi:MAG: hypothetical protein IKT07_11185 [Oscillospiraceae bacterium]|nr:hypothetical protein [Oscillospiraceae bacterium]